jgi:serine/threonine-protein kinase
VFLEDGVLQLEESDQLREILSIRDEKGRLSETYFRENESGYADFSYQVGVSYFYKYEDKNNKKNARKYFETASKSESIEEKKRIRAERLLVISEYYSKIGLLDEAGDVLITYRNYWDDLTAASEGNLVETDNERTAIVMYEELLGVIITKTAEFQEAGVRKEEMLKQIENIKQHLKHDFKNSEESVRKILEEEIQTLWKNIERAEKMIESVYGRKE